MPYDENGVYHGPPELDAPKGAIWICAACGKQSPNRNGGPGASYGWDSSCMSNAILCLTKTKEKAA